MIFCTRCGSFSHTAYDCSKPDQQLSPPAYAPEAKVPAAAERAIANDQAPPDASEPIFESEPRFKGCPPICTHANLPSFIDESSLLKWQGQFDGHKIKKKWRCEVCKHWHYWGTPRGPSGSSSGGERDSEIPTDWRPPKLKAETPTELPRHEVPEPAKEKALQKPAKTQSKRENELF